MCISPTQNELEQKNNSNNTDNDDDNSSSNDKINNKINTITTRTNNKICIWLREEHWLGVAQCPPTIFDGLVAPASARNLECNVAVVTTMA